MVEPGRAIEQMKVNKSTIFRKIFGKNDDTQIDSANFIPKSRAFNSTYKKPPLSEILSRCFAATRGRMPHPRCKTTWGRKGVQTPYLS